MPVGRSLSVLIADGHHRYAISRTYRDDQRAHDSGRNDLASELTMCYVGELVDDQLSVGGNSSALIKGVTDRAIRSSISLLLFEMSPGRPSAPRATPSRSLQRGASCPCPSRRSGNVHDSATRVLRGFARPRQRSARYPAFCSSSTRFFEISYQHGVDNIVALPSPRAWPMLAVPPRRPPVNIDEIRRTANRGRRSMPPKSTFFTRKLRTGL